MTQSVAHGKNGRNFGMQIAIYADGANREPMLKRYREGQVSGFTTNPTLMAKAGITDYANFARTILTEITDLPISFEVFSDDFDEMKRQALQIAAWGPNVNVKIPISNTKGQAALRLGGGGGASSCRPRLRGRSAWS
jgi:transaldolase